MLCVRSKSAASVASFRQEASFDDPKGLSLGPYYSPDNICRAELDSDANARMQAIILLCLVSARKVADKA